MANDDVELEPDVELLGEAEDNARSLTSGLVITTFVLGLLALFAIIKAQGAYGLGPFKG
jgi:hypothetical protein